MEIKSRKEARSAGDVRYFTGVPCDYGHVDFRFTSSGGCRECQRIRLRERYQRQEVKEKFKLRHQERYSNESVREKTRERNATKEVKERRKAYMKKWRESDRGKAAISSYNSDPDVVKKKFESAQRARRSADKIARRRYLEKVRYNTPEGAAREVMRRMLKRCVKNKTDRTNKMLGYSAHDLRVHIERQFTKGMSWDNHGEWHIDHIVPISHFIKSNVTDPSVVNALTNLRPLWADENIKKSDSRDFLI